MRRSVRVGLPTVLAAALLLGCQTDAGGQPAAQRSPSTARDSASSTGSASSTPATTESDSSSVSASQTASASATDRSGQLALFFGDSNFVGGGCSPDAYQDMAAIAAGRLGYRPVIRGEGGTGFSTGNAAYGLPDFVDQIRQGSLEVSPAPRLVVVEGGSNDTGSSLGGVTRSARKVLRLAHATYPDALLVLMGPIDVRAGQGDVGPGIVRSLRRAAHRQGVPFLDAYDWLPWRTQGDLVCSDYDHATLAGQRIVGRTLADALESVGA